MLFRGGFSWSWGWCAFVLLAGCVTTPPATPRVQEAGGQTTADARISTTSPLIVEWPAAERGRLETKMAHGAVAVRYAGAELEIVEGCRPSGSYRFVPMVPKSEHLVFGSALDLDASFPLGAARLGGRLESGKQLELTTRLVGRWEVQEGGSMGELPRPCRRATHVITAATVGAFRLYSSVKVQTGGSGEAREGVRLSGSADQERSIVNSDGSPDRCSDGSTQGPPRGCGALIRLELSSIEAAREDLVHELGTLNFVPIEKRLSGAVLEDTHLPIPFPMALCSGVVETSPLREKKPVESYCEAADIASKKTHGNFLSAEDLEQLEAALKQNSNQPLSQLLLIDGKMRREQKADDTVVQTLQSLADEHDAETDLGYYARYELAGSGRAEIEERNLRELLHHHRLSAAPWPRMRLARLMVTNNRAHAVALAQSARSLASQCSEERIEILDWLGREGTGVLSSGELFDIQLDAVLALSAQGQLPSTSPLGLRAIQTHDFQTWDASKKELEQDQWALGALYWAEGAECLYRGNRKCAAIEWRELLEKAPHSPYVVPAYQALMRVTGRADPARLAALSALRPRVEPGSKQRKAIAEQPGCGPLDDKALQAVLDEAQELAVLHAHQLSKSEANWEADSLAALAPTLSSCALESPSNGKERLLTVRIHPEEKQKVRVTSPSQSPESRALSACVERRTAGNASLFSTPFSVTIRVAEGSMISFDHNQGWAQHVRERFSCSSGDDAACIRLGKAWLEGADIPREPEQALAIFSSKCREGNQEACVEEALLRKEEGQAGRPRALLRRACDEGQGRACRHLARMEQKGDEDDWAQLYGLFSRACDSPVSDPTSCVELWYAQSGGALPPLNEQQSTELLEKACRALGHGTVDGPCSSPAELMAAYPHQADQELGKLTCAHGIWQGCESAFIRSRPEERPRWARAGCYAGSPDACAWLTSNQSANLDRKKEVELLSRTLELCESGEETGHESICDDPEEIRKQLQVLRWKGKPERP